MACGLCPGLTRSPGSVSVQLLLPCACGCSCPAELLHRPQRSGCFPRVLAPSCTSICSSQPLPHHMRCTAGRHDDVRVVTGSHTAAHNLAASFAQAASLASTHCRSNSASHASAVQEGCVSAYPRAIKWLMSRTSELVRTWLLASSQTAAWPHLPRNSLPRRLHCLVALIAQAPLCRRHVSTVARPAGCAEHVETALMSRTGLLPNTAALHLRNRAAALPPLRRRWQRPAHRTHGGQRTCCSTVHALAVALTRPNASSASRTSGRFGSASIAAGEPSLRSIVLCQAACGMLQSDLSFCCRCKSSGSLFYNINIILQQMCFAFLSPNL